MQQIISFLIKNKYFLLFLFLEIIAISLTIQSHSYHKSKFVNSANLITGSIYSNFNSVGNYFHLKEYNAQLAEENVRLKNIIAKNNNQESSKPFTKLDSLIYQQKYTFISAKVSRNDYTKSNNFLTLDRGRNDSIQEELGVITSRGIVGVTTNVSSKYTRVMSVLNENSRINARLINNTHFGTITWDGKDYNTLQFEDLPRQANIKLGDTIITGGKSTIFPEGILIGTINKFEIEDNKYKIINVYLFNDMSAIGHVNVIINLDKQEIRALENNNE